MCWDQSMDGNNILSYMFTIDYVIKRNTLNANTNLPLIDWESTQIFQGKLIMYISPRCAILPTPLSTSGQPCCENARARMWWFFFFFLQRTGHPSLLVWWYRPFIVFWDDFAPFSLCRWFHPTLPFERDSRILVLIELIKRNCQV